MNVDEEHAFPTKSFSDPTTGRSVLQLTHSPRRSVHGYYDICPWSPDGARIVFTRMDSPGSRQGEICVMDADGNNLTSLATTNRVAPNDGARPQWSSDGRRVYFNDTDSQGNPGIGFYDFSVGQLGCASGQLRMMAPTGNVLAFHSVARDYSDDDIIRRREELGAYIKDMDTDDCRLVASLSECIDLHPRRDDIRDWHIYIKHTKWAPDGSRLLFVCTNESLYSRQYGEFPAVKDLYTVRPDGTGLRYVGPFGNHPIWHPDSHHILTNSLWHPGDKRTSLVLIDADTGERTLLTTRLSGSGHPSFSPDGRYVAIDRVWSDIGEMFLLDTHRDTVDLLACPRVTDHSHAGTHLHPVWSRDGRNLLYASDASGVSQICVISIRTM